jgi:hypothetical protein
MLASVCSFDGIVSQVLHNVFLKQNLAINKKWEIKWAGIKATKK